MPKGDKAWIHFKYERLPSICYWCGCLDHDDRDYDLWVDSKGTLTTKQQQFEMGMALAVGVMQPLQLSGSPCLCRPRLFGCSIRET